MKILNLFAGIGGNRSGFDGEHDITSVELDPRIAEIYAGRYPNDKLVIGDALVYCQDHFKEYDFIWASPPCQSHGQYRHNIGVKAKGYKALVPDMTGLYGLIVFFQTYYDGLWVVENTRPYYQPLIEPTVRLGRHLLWANFPIGNLNVGPSRIREKNAISSFDGVGDLVGSKISNKRQVLRNQVDCDLARHVLCSASLLRG